MKPPIKPQRAFRPTVSPRLRQDRVADDDRIIAGCLDLDHRAVPLESFTQPLRITRIRRADDDVLTVDGGEEDCPFIPVQDVLVCLDIIDLEVRSRFISAAKHSAPVVTIEREDGPG
ncbi:MAG: hypothetical protein QOE31_951 [Solirubrobacteraceae bacterium]|nr:hypothetical protein [Solirubrobacteraceae bacterium]